MIRKYYIAWVLTMAAVIFLGHHAFCQESPQPEANSQLSPEQAQVQLDQAIKERQTVYKNLEKQGFVREEIQTEEPQTINRAHDNFLQQQQAIRERQKALDLESEQARGEAAAEEAFIRQQEKVQAEQSPNIYQQMADGLIQDIKSHQQESQKTNAAEDAYFEQLQSLQEQNKELLNPPQSASSGYTGPFYVPPPPPDPSTGPLIFTALAALFSFSIAFKQFRGQRHLFEAFTEFLLAKKWPILPPILVFFFFVPVGESRETLLQAFVTWVDDLPVLKILAVFLMIFLCIIFKPLMKKLSK